MSNLKSGLLRMFTDDPVNWIKWGIVFAVLIVVFIISYKITKKIEYRLSVQRKADIARSKGHVIEGARLKKARKKGTYEERKESNKTTYSGTYVYTLNGEEKEYRAYFGNNYPPKQIDLYYKNSPKKLFSVEEYYWGAPKGILFLSLIFLPFIVAALTGIALDIPSFTMNNDKGSAFVLETGEWETSTITDENYSVTIRSPEKCYPNGKFDLYTWYEDPSEELDLEVYFDFVDEVPGKEENIVRSEAVLWDNDIVYDIYEVPNRRRPERNQDLFRGYIEIGADKYIQVEIFGISEVHTPDYKFLENDDFQKSFGIETEVINQE